MSNVAKLKKKAAEFEQKKQYDKALGVYLQILNGASPGDEDVEVSLYNRVGDLMLRQGNTADAVTYYEKAVDLYAEGGFFNNAIALCNKILRQSPGRSVIYYKLGKISAKKGFRSDAKQNFLEYADRMQQGGQIDEAFRALKEFADLVPDQEDVRLMLAEQLSKKDRRAEALEQLQFLYDKYESEGRSAEARAALERMRAIDPDVKPTTAAVPQADRRGDLVFLDVSWSGGAQPTGGTPSRSATPARGAPTPTPLVAPGYAPPSRDLETPSLLPPSADIRSVRSATPAGPSDTSIPLVEGFDLVDDRPAPVAPMAGVSSGAGLDDAQTSDVSAAPLPGLEPTSAVVQDYATPLSGSQFAALALDGMSAEPKFEVPAHDLVLPGELPTIGGDLELIMPPDEPIEFGPSDEANSGIISGFDPTASRRTTPSDFLAGLPTLDTVDDRYGAGTAPTDERRSPDLEFLDVGGSQDLPFLDVTEDASASFLPADVEPSELAMAAELDAELLPEASEAEESSFEALELVAPPGAEDGAGAESATTYASWHTGASTEYPDTGDVSVTSPAAPTADFDDADDDAAYADVAAAALVRPGADQALATLRERVSSTPDDHVLRRRLAEALLDAGERDEGAAEMERAMTGFERAGDLDQARSVCEEVIRLQPNSVAHHQKRVEYAFRASDRARLGDAYLELADALFRTGQGDKSRAVYERVIELAPDNARARAALNLVAAPEAGESPSAARTPAVASRAVEPVSAPPAGSDDSFVNLGDWLREGDAPKSTRMVTDAKEPGEGEEFDFAEMLQKFKQGVAENVDEDDHESHYDLGVAFKEMGLVEEAIAEFQKALRATGRRVRTYEALGQCFLEQSQFQVAATVLQRALVEPGIGDEQLVGVLYLLGYASEALGRRDDAITYYQRVFAVDIRFRDVTERLNGLQQAGAR